MKLVPRQITVEKNNTQLQQFLSASDVQEHEGTFIDCIADTDGRQDFDKVRQQTTIEATKSFSSDDYTQQSSRAFPGVISRWYMTNIHTQTTCIM